MSNYSVAQLFFQLFLEMKISLEAGGHQRGRGATPITHIIRFLRKNPPHPCDIASKEKPHPAT